MISYGVMEQFMEPPNFYAWEWLAGAKAEVSKKNGHDYKKSMAYRNLFFDVEAMNCWSCEVHPWANGAGDANQLKESVHSSLNEPMNHWISEPMNQWLESMAQRLNESMIQWIRQISESMSQRLNDSVSQWIDESMNQWNTESRKYWVNKSIIRRSNEPMNDRCFINDSMNQWIKSRIARWRHVVKRPIFILVAFYFPAESLTFTRYLCVYSVCVSMYIYICMYVCIYTQMLHVWYIC